VRCGFGSSGSTRLSAAISIGWRCRSTDWEYNGSEDAGHSGRKRAEVARWPMALRSLFRTVMATDRAGTLRLQRWIRRRAGQRPSICRAVWRDWTAGAADAHRWPGGKVGDNSRGLGECSHGGRGTVGNNSKRSARKLRSWRIGGRQLRCILMAASSISRAYGRHFLGGGIAAAVVILPVARLGRHPADSGSVVNVSGGLSRRLLLL